MQKLKLTFADEESLDSDANVYEEIAYGVIRKGSKLSKASASPNDSTCQDDSKATRKSPIIHYISETALNVSS